MLGEKKKVITYDKKDNQGKVDNSVFLISKSILEML